MRVVWRARADSFLVVRYLHHVPHRLDVLFRNEPGQPLLRAGLLARSRQHAQDPPGSGGAKGHGAETQSVTTGEERKAVGEGEVGVERGQIVVVIIIFFSWGGEWRGGGGGGKKREGPCIK